MVWWIVAGVVTASLLGLVVVLAALRRRLLELDRVSTLARERTAQAQRRLTANLEGIEPVLSGLQQRATSLQHRLAESRSGDASGSTRSGS